MCSSFESAWSHALDNFQKHTIKKSVLKVNDTIKVDARHPAPTAGGEALSISVSLSRTKVSMSCMRG